MTLAAKRSVSAFVTKAATLRYRHDVIRFHVRIGLAADTASVFVSPNYQV
jgi:hypothetical protein